jgi:hypothetical protein
MVAVTGCGLAPHVVPVDPGVNFAAHRESRGLVIDRMAGVHPAVLVPAGWWWFGSGPRFLLRADATTLATLWQHSGDFIVRRGTDQTTATLGWVRAGWDHGAITLALTPTGVAGVNTSMFRRLDGRPAPAALGQHADTIFDVRGVYRADIVDHSGESVGWLRVRIAPDEATMIYDGVLPADIDGPLAAAAAARLDVEVGWLEDHAENPYVGN